ncbi:MAG TPA: hypothetical protein VK973_07030 [Arenicellales bacterium]|nr:hypothetical protein [Arenicellales bacterium]
MLTLEDCIELCGLTHEEIGYLVEHEHISDLRAAELGEKYVTTDDAGTPHLRRSILDDIETLKRRNRARDAQALEAFIRDFVLSHPHLNRVRP